MRRTCSSVLARPVDGDVGEDMAAQGEVALGEAVEEGVGRRRGAGAGQAEGEAVALAREGDARPGRGWRATRSRRPRPSSTKWARSARFSSVAGAGPRSCRCSRASSQAWMRAAVFSRSSRPFLRSNTRRGSPTASRPKRVGGMPRAPQIELDAPPQVHRCPPNHCSCSVPQSEDISYLSRKNPIYRNEAMADDGRQDGAGAADRGARRGLCRPLPADRPQPRLYPAIHQARHAAAAGRGRPAAARPLFRRRRGPARRARRRRRAARR